MELEWVLVLELVCELGLVMVRVLGLVKVSEFVLG